ncbi:hypothetical protein [Gloeomargarita lithophora]|uniref:hypothetical protein n=1 Tax=Gloeomargarita lithophora TaxID=1188228 RepID=UPI0008F81139|nr:hypothetical protein [Gloeomargarita lithophora]
MHPPDPGIDLAVTHPPTSFAAPIGIQVAEPELRRRLAKTAYRLAHDSLLLERLNQRVYELLITDRRQRRERSGQSEHWL